MKKISLLLFTLLFANSASAACKWVWVDHDYDAGTPPIQRQICDSTVDVPAIRPPSVPPIQTPQVRPITTPTVPPVGTRSCRTQSVYENGRWVNKQICQ